MQVVDASARELGADRDLAALKLRLAEAARLSFAAEQPRFEQKGLTRWNFGELPETLTLERAGQRITGYPALQDDGDGVALTLLDTRDAADAASRRGVVRLVGFELADALRQCVKPPPDWTTTAMQLRAAIAPERLQEDLRDAVADRAFLGDDPLPRDAGAYAAQVKRARARLPAVADGAWRLLAAIAAEYQALSQRIAALPASRRALAAEVKAQRDALVYPGFIGATPWTQLHHLPRYLQAISRRIARYPEHPDRDARHAAQVATWWERYHRGRADSEQRTGRVSPALDAFRWMLEELRVSLFAQELRTPTPVSFKRIERAWAEISR